MSQEQHLIPVLPLRDVVVYPHMVVPLFVGRVKSIKALDQALSGTKHIFLVAQKNATVDDPKPTDLHKVGTIATVLQLLKLPDGTVKVLVEGNERAKVVKFSSDETLYVAEVVAFDDEVDVDETRMRAVCRTLLSRFESYAKLNKKVPPEVVSTIGAIDELGRLIDTVAAHISLKVESKQRLLEVKNVTKRAERLLVMLETELDLMQVEKSIRGRVKDQMEKSQREYYLNEKMKAIKKELGGIAEDEEEPVDEIEDLKAKIKKVGMSKEAKDKALAELRKLKLMPPMSAEATVIRSYLDWLIQIPWKTKSKLKHDLTEAARILDRDHYGLEKVKERILEFLAVQQRAKKVKGPILCLVGPPGVGKTSLGQSVADATGRKFVRMSLGGVRDEAEIRGHRRTYIGSLPGKIIQNVKKVGTKNPLFMLDEVDKLGMDFRGDPASALLEVLDPEQNHAFNDHYLEVDYDLSDITFIATANSLNIPGPLLDRMEVIRIPGYTELEKLNIAQRYLVPKEIKQNGLKPKEINITDGAIREIIRHYTREAGVRNLEREISKICRKVVKELLLGKKKQRKVITQRSVEKYLGVKLYHYGLADETDQIGQVTGLAWTEVGGELLKIEAAVVPGQGKTTYTGRLGDVMQESIQAALTVVRSRSGVLGVDPEFYAKNDIHVHVPEGATPKDGPSAGVSMCTALVSMLTKIPVRADIAMTGEITLRGEVLPIGGLKEKLLAALRGGIKTVIIPKENEKDLKEIPRNITSGLTIEPVRWVDEVLGLALVEAPKPTNAKGRLSDTALLSSEAQPKRKRGDRPRTHH